MYIFVFFPETAVNIGYSSKLLTDDMKVFIVDKDSKEEVCEQLQTANEEMKKPNKPNVKSVYIRMGEVEGEAPNNDGEADAQPASFGIVINGHSLVCLSLCTQITHL